MTDSPAAPFLVEKQPWLAHAACVGAATDVWFEEGFTNEALDVCACCPVRKQCGEQALVEEGVAPYGRYGVRGGMTAAQREVVYRRGGLQGRDGQRLCRGLDGHRKVPPVPKDGVLWSRHHTALAKKLIAHLSRRPAGHRLTPHRTLARTLDCGAAPLQVVLTELWAIGVLDLDPPSRYVYRGVIQSALPKHLRSNPSGEGDSHA